MSTSSASPPVTEPGAAHGVAVTSPVAAEGTSETLAPGIPAVAPDAHADGETDVAMPPTTSF
jgi:hypothetical protein